MTRIGKKPFLRMAGMHIIKSIVSSRVMVMPQRPTIARFPVCCCCVTQYPQVPVSVFRVPSAFTLEGCSENESSTFCSAEQNVLDYINSINPSNVRPDGTLKTDTGTCGNCVTQQQQTGNRAVLGLCGITITLLLVMDVMMCIPVIRKKDFFRIMVIVLSVLCIIFLIAAVSSAAVTFMSVAQCFFLSDFSQAQYMPSPIGQKINGYTPSAGGASNFNKMPGSGLFEIPQASGVAAYLKPYVLPSSGATQLIISIVLLSLFTVIFAIKVNWAEESSSEGTRMMERVL